MERILLQGKADNYKMVRLRTPLVRAIAVLLIMLDTLRRLFFGGAKPIDRTMLVIEVLVLGVIAYETISAIWRKRTVHKRLNALFALMEKGISLQQAPPDTDAAAHDWAQAVDVWITETTQVLSKYSAQAVASFNHQGKPASISHAGISGIAHGHHAQLLIRLENLRAIMEKPDVYY